jgi:hypothetical protein
LLSGVAIASPLRAGSRVSAAGLIILHVANRLKPSTPHRIGARVHFDRSNSNELPTKVDINAPN